MTTQEGPERWLAPDERAVEVKFKRSARRPRACKCIHAANVLENRDVSGTLRSQRNPAVRA